MTETATGLRRGLAILLAFETARELGVTQVAELVGRDKGHVSRMLKVLAEEGFVERDPETLAYRLGWRVFALAAVAGEERLTAIAPQRLRELVHAFEEGSHLSVLRGAAVLTIMSEAPPGAVQAVNWVGRTSPAGCTSAGYALLVDHGRAELAPFLADREFRRDHPRAPQSVAELSDRLTAARELGFALADEEFEDGLVAVGAPIHDFRGRVVAAVSLSAPKFRFGARLDEAGAAVRAVADDLSRALGWDPEQASMLARWPSSSSSPSAAST
jgi:IclR family KDG regulon transcriptional repressor